jgi:hypothetical protein
MKKMLVAALIVPVALLGAVRPAKAGDKVAAVLAGVAVGIGAALILDAIAPRPVVAAPVVYQPAPPPVVYQPAPVVYQPAPVIVQTPPPVIITPSPVVYQTPPHVVYQPTRVIVKGPRHGPHRVTYAPHPVYVRDRHGRGYWADRYIPDR